MTREIIETVLSDPDEKLLESAKQVFVDFHRAGALIPMLQARQGQVSPESLSELIVSSQRQFRDGTRRSHEVAFHRTCQLQ
jgi:hypothetical protein